MVSERGCVSIATRREPVVLGRWLENEGVGSEIMMGFMRFGLKSAARSGSSGPRISKLVFSAALRFSLSSG